MNVLYLLIPLALAVVIAAGLAFVWAVGDGQFDDPEGDSIRMLEDDEK